MIGFKTNIFDRIMDAYIGTKMYMEAVKRAGTLETETVIKAFEDPTWEGQSHLDHEKGGSPGPVTRNNRPGSEKNKII
jgi:hypothetical protein